MNHIPLTPLSSSHQTTSFITNRSWLPVQLLYSLPTVDMADSLDKENNLPLRESDIFSTLNPLGKKKKLDLDYEAKSLERWRAARLLWASAVYQEDGESIESDITRSPGSVGHNETVDSEENG